MAYVGFEAELAAKGAVLLASRAMKTCYAHFTFPTAPAAGID